MSNLFVNKLRNFLYFRKNLTVFSTRYVRLKQD